MLQIIRVKVVLTQGTATVAINEEDTPGIAPRTHLLPLAYGFTCLFSTHSLLPRGASPTH